MREVPKQLKPFLFKKGNKLGGRKPGKSLKEYARQYLSMMNDDEKIKFMNSLDPDIVWRMAEGNPAQDDSLAVKGTLTIEISKEGAEKYDINPTSSDNTKG